MRKYHLDSLASLLSLALLALSPLAADAEKSPNGLWRDLSGEELQALSDRSAVPYHSRTVALDRAALDALLYSAPMERSSAALVSETQLAIPLPDGEFAWFRIEEAPIMAPELAAAYPGIKTYSGQGIDDPAATLRFSVTPLGFHGQILSPAGRIFLDPHSPEEVETVISYFTRDYPAREGSDWQCLIDELVAIELPESSSSPEGIGIDMRTYRLALAATGEYTQFHGGTVGDGLAAQVVAMTRVNGVYETELAIRMELIANNDDIIYTNGATDPYSNNNGGAMLSQNQTNLDNVIGSANYDIGHVFSTGGGGVAGLGVSCDNGFKAWGVTGLSQPINDVFYIDYVAHEMGHQWGGTHTFNGSSGACSGGNRTASTAYEPGSGSTIQAYAGICSGQNIQSNSDAYFHAISLDQMAAYSRTGDGNSCAVTEPVGNQAPVVTADDDHTIPVETPFELCGSATDPDPEDADALTYNWEQWDLGPAGAPNSPSGNAPIFRSLFAETTGSRVFPKWDDILNNTQTMGEILPTYARTMNFRLTARDNRAAGGNFGDNMNGSTPEVQITVADDSGPFLVTGPIGGENWTAGTSRVVTWDVAGTDSGIVSCSEVSILLSVDGGYTYPVTLSGSTPNDGSKSITVPAISSTQARVMVRCADSVFFDVSNGDLTIDSTEALVFGTNFDECNGLRLWDKVVQ